MPRYPDDDYRSSESRHAARREHRDRDHRDRVESQRDRRTAGDRLDRDTKMMDAMDARMDARMDGRLDSRMDSRLDARMDARVDPRMDPRMDARIDPRMDARMDARMDTRMGDRIDARMDGRIDGRMDSRLDGRGDRAMTSRMEPVMDIRPDQRANTASRLEPRPDRAMDGRGADPQDADVLLYRDSNTGELYREVRAVPSRSPYPRDERDYDAPSARNRTAMDTSMRDRDQSRPEYTEYFCPGEGIEREVIQFEICKYLGQDATCRPGKNKEGRSGYWVRAYRPFTSAMEQSLRQETIKWHRDRARRARQGRSQGTYAEMQARQEAQRRYPANEMDLDDDDYQRPAPRHADIDSRPVTTGRVAAPASSAYPPDPGYSGQYAISANPSTYASGQPGYYPPEREARAFGGGNTTPPSISRSGHPGAYGQPNYPGRTVASVTSSTPATYGDPRRETMGAYPPGYSDSRRHGR